MESKWLKLNKAIKYENNKWFITTKRKISIEIIYTKIREIENMDKELKKEPKWKTIIMKQELHAELDKKVREKGFKTFSELFKYWLSQTK